MRGSLVLVVAVASCTGSESGGGEPSISIVEPVDGATVCGTPLHVVVDVENLELVPPVDDPEDALPGTGHVDIMLNGQDAAMVAVTTTDLPDVGEGEWQLKVELSNADHTPVLPYAGDLIYITVSAAECE